jgi:hypothetical protein
MRWPRNPVPPNTVTRREDMSRNYRVALSSAIISSAFPEAKPVSAHACRSRWVASIHEFQACARSSFASGTDGSDPVSSSGESENSRSQRDQRYLGGVSRFRPAWGLMLFPPEAADLSPVRDRGSAFATMVVPTKRAAPGTICLAGLGMSYLWLPRGCPW